MTTPTTDGKPAAVPTPDVMPDPLDDLDRAEAVLSESMDRLGEGTPLRAPEPAPDERDLAREAIAQRYRELRDRETAEHPEAEVQAQEARGYEEPAQQGEQRVRLVVDGKPMDLPLSEVVKRAQVNSAIDARLAEAKAIVAEAKATRHQADDDFGEERQPQPRQQHHNPNDKLRSIAERIQVGDTDEGQAALDELVGVMEQRAQAREFTRGTEQQMKAALDRFMHKHPGIAQDPDLGTAGFQILARTIKDDLRGLGLAGTEQALGAMGNDVKQLAMVSAGLRQAGHKLKSFDDYLNQTGATMTRKFGGGTGRHIGTSSEIDARIERKRALGPAPRMAGLRMETPDDRPRPKTSAEIVRQMRKARGFQD